MPTWLPIEGWRDVMDIALVAVFVWAGIGYLRRTHARTAIAGLALVVAVYFVARGLELRLAEALLQGFFAVLVLVLVVVFQDDLRRLFEQLGSWRRGAAQLPPGTETLDLLVRAVARMASTRTGALIVLPGREPLERHLEGGVRLEGRLSEPLLLSVFDTSSPGHDGAVVLRGSTLERFAVHLPLSAHHEALGPGGTRHAAALGLAERCDATCIVVSEERGTVSLARDGEIRQLRRAEDLVPALRATFEGAHSLRPWWRGRAALDAAIALAGALALWMVFVPGSDLSEVTVEAPVEITNLPRDLALEAVEPGAVEVTLRGLRRDLLLGEPSSAVTIVIDAYLARLGRRTFSISPETVRKPEGLTVVSVEPDRIRISLQPVETVEGAEGS